MIYTGSVISQELSLSNSVLRSELLERIDKSSMPVLVCSMAGYGKTILLRQLKARVQRAVMFELDRGDNRLPAFINHLSNKVGKYVSRLENNLDNTYGVLASICQAAEENNMTLIFDNCQLIDNREVYHALQYIMSAAERGFKVVISSRKIPDFAVRFLLEERCTLLGRDDLALSPKEVDEMVKIYLNTDNPQLGREVYDFTQGWAAGVVFCLRGKGDYFSNGKMTWEGINDQRFIKQYLRFEVLADIPEAVVEFAQKASLLENLDVDFCDIILGSNNSRKYLKYLRENGLFFQEGCGIGKDLAWIEIFRNTMSAFMSTREEAVIVEKAVEYYLRRRLYLEAVGIALRFEQPGPICKALSMCGANLLEEERFELLGNCAKILEKSSQKLDASIHGILAQYYYIAGDYTKMEYHFNMADSMFGKENIYSAQRSLYRGLLKYDTDRPRYRKLVNNALFYLNEYNLKLPFLLPRDKRVLEEIIRLSSVEEELQHKKPMQVKQFGTFKVIVTEDGREIPWRTKKGGELFAYLVSLNGNAVERNQLFDIIWKDELPNNPVALLHNMIYNIRKELSAYKLENVVQYKNKKYSIDMSLIDSDMDSVTRVCSAVARKDIDALIENEHVLSDFWGTYLENIDSIWVAERKDYYDKMFIDGCIMLADFYYDNRIYEKALIYLQNALKVDIFSERIVEKFLDCYSKLGKFDKLRDKYEEFCDLLARELDIEPSNDLKQAYQRCMQRNI